MKTHFYFTIFLAIMVLAGCKKSAKETTVYGQVRTFGTEEAIRHEPVKVQLLEREPSSTWNSPDNYKVLAETMTDQNQNYTLSHNLYSKVDYYIGVEDVSVKHQNYLRPTYSSLGKEERKINKTGGEIRLNYYLTAKGWLKLHMISENPQTGDIFGYSAGGGAAEVLGGGNINEIRKLPVAGNLEHTVYFQLRRNDEWTNWNEKIFITAFDTTYLEVRF